MLVSERAISVLGNSMVEPASRKPQKKESHEAATTSKDQYVQSANVPTDAQEKAIVARAMSMPETREEKVARIKERVDSGYYLSASIQGAIADAMLYY